ncbi:hypothetical protein SteCoe_2570 [Stentor coeruleus]|uniref:Importin N-terminal domain-containing protein n=1 Tax=Stentor coeruleus TaxID=5963 RepID=A0A1R2CZ09_9CILI|nr:hypothetical protein SteCoe_2570 [Stentor coeruleus]
MDESMLIQAFIASIGNDNEARQAAYQYFESIKGQPGLVPLLMTISLQNQNLEISQLAAIHLKNLSKHWKDNLINENDKSFLRTNLAVCLKYTIHEKIRAQYEEITHFVLKSDHPWDTFFDQVHQCLITSDLIYSGLIMIYQASKLYECIMTDKRDHLLKLIDNYFPSLIDLLETLIQHTTEESFKHTQLILSIYWVSFYLELPSKYAENECLERWLKCFRTILITPSIIVLPTEPHVDLKDYEQHPQWLCKKWSAQIIHRFFTRYFNKTYLRDQNLMICEYFQSTWALEFYNIILVAVFNSSKVRLSDPVMNFYLKFLNQGVKLEPVMKKITPEIAGKLLVGICLSLLYRTPSDEELWTDNPLDFIRKEEEICKANYSKKTSAVTLMNSLCEARYLFAFFNYIKNELNKIVETPNLLRKEALLMALGCISELARPSYNKLREDAENILFTHVFPEFNSNNGFMRFRAPWVYARYGQIQFQNKDQQQLVFTAMCKLMVDVDLPVRYSAAVSLPRVLHWEISKISLSKEIQNLLQIYLKLINEIESEELVESLESIVSTFPDEVRPYALELSQYLVESFENTVIRPRHDRNDDNNLAAVSILNAISKIIDVFNKNSDEIIKLSQSLIELLKFCFKNSDFFEESANILSCLLYYAPQESLSYLYVLFECLIISILGNESIKAFASQYIEEIFPPMANFITKYKMLTLQYMPNILNMCFKLLDMDEDEVFLGCEVLICVLENYKLDCIPLIIDNAMKCFKLNYSKKYKIACTQIIFTAIYNNPTETFSRLDCIFEICEYAKASVKYYLESLAKIHLIFGLGAFFTVPVPQSLSNMLFQYFQLIIQCSYDPEMEIRDKANDTINKVNVNLNYNALDSEDEDYDEDSDDDDDDFPFGTEPTNFYDSKFECLNPNDCVKELVTIIRNNSAEGWNAYWVNLTEKEKKIVNYIISN